MDHMDEHDDDLNVKVILLGVGGAALAAVLVALARRDDDGQKAQAAAVIDEVKKDAKKAAKAAKKKRKEIVTTASALGERLADDVKESAAALGADAKAAERDLKAAAWDAQQEAHDAEGRLRAAGHKVVDDATHLASRVGAEARNLAGEGRERISHLRQRDDGDSRADREFERLHAEIDKLKSQLGETGRKGEKDLFGLASRFSGKGAATKDDVASQAAAAAIAHLEKSLKAKAPALLAARNRAQVMEILQQDLGPTIRETATQAAMAALGMWESGRERAKDAAGEMRETARDASKDVRDKARHLKEEVQAETEHLAAEVSDQEDAIRVDGKRRFWRAAGDGRDAATEEAEQIKAAAQAAEEEARASEKEREHRGKSGLFWGGAGLGLALYALLDAERRETVLRLANEASVQVQELVRDLQGYDDEF